MPKSAPTRPIVERRINPRAVLLGALLLTLAAYLPGMTGGFAFDDYNNILLNADLRSVEFSFKDLIQAGWSGMASPLKRPLPMMSFAINFATTGNFVAAFKLTNLAIHLANGVLLFVLLRLILGAHSDTSDRRNLSLSMVAAGAAAIWLLHPLNLTSVLYVVQRMNSLSAMFSLAAMICYCVGRRRLESNRPRGWWVIGGGVPMFTVLGILSKENAVLTIPLIALIEGCFFRLRTHHARDRTALIALFVIVLVLPTVAAVMYFIVEPEFITRRYALRSFTLVERILTEGRVLWFYLSLLLIPTLSRFGLYHDDFQISTSLANPITTGAALAGIAFALVLALLTVRRRPLLAFAVGWYLIGHALESSVIALELVHEHRNYLPSIGVIFALSYVAVVLLPDYLTLRLQRVLGVTVIALCATVTFIRAGDWSDPITLAVVEAERHPNSFRATYDLGRTQFGLYKLSGNEEDYENALTNLERAAALNRAEKRPLVELMKLEYASGRTPKPEWRAQLLQRYGHALFHPSDTFDLHLLTRCRAEATCKFPMQDIVDLYHAALSNPKVASYSKAQLMIDLAILYMNEAGDVEPALNLLDDAVEMHPDEFEFRKVRAQIYVRAGLYDEVEQEIFYMRSVSVWRDRFSPPLDTIRGIEVQLAAAIERDDGEP